MGKSLFISLYISGNGVLLVIGLWNLMDSGSFTGRIGWAGVSLGALSVVGYFLWLYLAFVPRTSRSLWHLIGATGVGAVLAVTGAAEEAGSPGRMLMPAGAFSSFLGTLAYVFWYSRLDRAADCTLKVGNRIPDIEFVDLSGALVSGQEFIGRVTVLLFYRGNWCPLCHAQVGEVAAQYLEFKRRGIEVVLISPQPQEHTRKLAEKFQVPFRFMRDPESSAARAFGILHKYGLPLGLQAFGYDSDTVLPTVVITDANGIVLHVDRPENYRVRPEPQFLLSVIDRYFQDHMEVEVDRAA